MTIVTLRYWAAAKDAAGVAEDKVEAASLADALAAGLQAARDRGAAGGGTAGGGVGGADPEQFALVLARCSFLVNGQPAGTRPPASIALPGDAVVEVLPPFAGG